MDLVTVLDHCDELGVLVEARGDRLRVVGMKRLPAEVAEGLREHRRPILELLQEEHLPARGRALFTCRDCGWIGGGPADRAEYLVENHRASGHRVEVRA